jgi:integrase
MPRTAFLEPTLREARKKRGLAAWALNVPPDLSDTGKRKELFFRTKKDATSECERLKARKENFGRTITEPTPARMAEAVECYKLLDGSATLLDAVRGFLAVQHVRRSSITFLDLFNRFLEAKKDRNEQYRRELRITRDRFPKLHGRLVVDISHNDLEPLLAQISPGGRNSVMRYLRALFNYGIKRGFLIENPISRLDFADRPRQEVEILSNKQVEGMLQHALAEDLKLLPFLVLGIFCGIRPDGELQKLEWRDLDLADSMVVIRPEVSKTRRRRFIDLSENAEAWLRATMKQKRPAVGRVVEFAESELRTHRKANWEAAGIKQWPQQGMRHTYCSNWLALHKDINKLVLQSGHDSVDTMWRHYHRGTSETEAHQFWAIMPPAQPERKIVPLPA